MTNSTSHTARNVALAGGGVVALLAGVYGGAYALSGDGLPRDTVVAGVAVGGLGEQAAVERLEAEYGATADAPMTLSAGEKSWKKTPAELGLSVDWQASVAQASAERSWDPRVIWSKLTGGQSWDPVVKVDDAKLGTVASEIGKEVDREPEDAKIVYEKTFPVLTKAVVGQKVDAAATASALQAAYLKSTDVAVAVEEAQPAVTTEEATAVLDAVAKPATSGPVTVTEGGKSAAITPEMIAGALTFPAVEGDLKPSWDATKLHAAAKPALAALNLTGAKNASFTFASGRPTIVPSADGRAVKPEDLVKAVEGASGKGATRTAALTVTTEKPELTTEKAKALGITEVTGEFSTNFPASQYRITNIGKSSRLINGTLLLPGETFSMNKALGERTLANGWAAGGAIDGGKVVERMGGGISQTTTTLFNAIFFAGLEDVYHKPHSLYFSRYPMGREATLDWVSVDMKFRNDSKYGVLIQAYTNNPKPGGQGTVTVKIWSTKTYDVKASAPRKGPDIPPGAPKQDASAVCTPQTGKAGFRVDYDRLFYSGGTLVKKEPFTWTYSALTPVTCTNPNARPDRIER